MESTGEMVKNFEDEIANMEDSVFSDDQNHNSTTAESQVLSDIWEEFADEQRDGASSNDQNMDYDPLATTDQSLGSKRPMESETETEAGANPQKCLKGHEGQRVDVLPNPTEQPENLSCSPCKLDAGPYSEPMLILPVEERLTQFLDNMHNFAGTDLDAYQKFGAAEKTLVFEAQAKIIEAKEIFNKGQMVGFKTTEVNRVIAQLRQIATGWRNLRFGTLDFGNFVITAEIEDRNAECSKILTIANMDFLIFLDSKCPLFEILYLVKIGYTLCLCNFSME